MLLSIVSLIPSGNKYFNFIDPDNIRSTMTEKPRPSIHRKTVKMRHIQGSILGRKHGWVMVDIYGEPYERGYAHGYLLYREIKRSLKVFTKLIETEFDSLINYKKDCHRLMYQPIKQHFPEFFQELEGITSGAKSRGVVITVDDLIHWNAYLSMFSYYKGGKTRKQFEETPHQRCSAFIATGSATKKGDIVMAHNTHSDFATGQLLNIVLQIRPTQGHPFVMQTSPGFIASSSDWFLCSTGVIGCETTISRTNYTPPFSDVSIPYFCRIRQAMQYGTTIDDYVAIMTKYNAGDYACSWLLGDTNTGEIALFELGLAKHSIQRTRDGVFYGMNTAIDFDLRNEETTDDNYMDLSTSSGARNFRLNHLLNETYYGKIDAGVAKRILADHYDVFLGKTSLNGRGICKHGENNEDSRSGRVFSLFGCTDGKVTTSKMAKTLSFQGRFGSCCGRPFHIREYVKQHPKHKHWLGFVEDIASAPWTSISMDSAKN